MPFCTQCGKQISNADRFCPGCGTAPNAKPPQPPASSGDFLAGLSSRTASILCYVPVAGWIACVVVLATQRFQRERMVRFHAFQGLYLFVAWLLIDRVIGPAVRALTLGNLGIAALLKAAVLAAWIFMLVKTSQGEEYHLPVFGELADRSIAEQRY